MKYIASMLSTINIPIFYIFDALFFFVYTFILYATCGSSCGILGSYTYIIFYLFYSFFNGWISLSIKKLIEDYNLHGYYESKNKVIKLSKIILLRISVVCFILMLLFAILISNFIAVNIIKLVFISGCSLFLLPFICVYRGYLSANKFNNIVNISYIINYLIVIIFNVIGCFFIKNVLKLGDNAVLEFSVFSLFLGFLSSLIYLLFNMCVNKKKLEKKTLKVKENIVSNIEIKQNIKTYSFHYTSIQFLLVLFYLIEVLLLNMFLINNGYSINELNSIMEIFLSKGLSITVIILIIVLGIFNRNGDLKNIINKYLLFLLIIIVPASILLSSLADPLLTLLYGSNLLGVKVIKYYFISIIFSSLLIFSILLLFRLGKYKKVYFYLLFYFISNLILKVPLIYGFSYMGFQIYFGYITSMMLSCFITSFMILKYLGKKEKISYENFVSKIINFLIIIVVFVISLMVIKIMLPFNSTSKIISLLYILLVGIIELLIYCFLINKSNIIKNICIK